MFVFDEHDMQVVVAIITTFALESHRDVSTLLPVALIGAFGARLTDMHQCALVKDCTGGGNGVYDEVGGPHDAPCVDLQMLQPYSD